VNPSAIGEREDRRHASVRTTFSTARVSIRIAAWERGVSSEVWHPSRRRVPTRTTSRHRFSKVRKRLGARGRPSEPHHGRAAYCRASGAGREPTKPARGQPDARLSRHGSVGQWADIRRALHEEGCQPRLLGRKVAAKGTASGRSARGRLGVFLEPTGAGEGLPWFVPHVACCTACAGFSQRLPAGLEEGGKGSAGQ
jgi:hypothetical protein